MSVDDSRAVFAALLNHIPATMQATRLVLGTTAVGGGTEEDRRPQGEKAVRELGRQLTALNVAVMMVEHRLELLEGRPGLPESALVAIASEFSV